MTCCPSMPRTAFAVFAFLLLSVALIRFAEAQSGSSDNAKPAPVASQRVYFFGNSLTGGTMPAWHGDLGRSAGREWESHAWLGAGWQLWQHREQIGGGRDLFSPASKGDLTLDAGSIRSASEHVKAFHTGTWDAVVLQLFCPYLTEVTDAKWGRQLSGTKDVGDLGAATDLIRLSLARNPQVRVFLYQVWPPMDAGEPRDGIRGAEFPLRDEFHYEERWLQPYDAPTSPRNQATKPWRSRDFSRQVFAALRERFPELVSSGRLQMIPAGELFWQLDQRFRAGHAEGITDIRDFYTDVQHLRAGLPRYAVAALIFSYLFDASPESLDWKLYNDRGKYGPDPHNDIGELLEITPERATLVHDTIESLREGSRS